ncbi:MAG TPA: hypothetical protein VGP68_06100, partial [Gemmataceae bacterium]|nr:hypothetical protein [Gemmataceae bacterium]
MPAINNLGTPWTLHFDREGTEDVAIICDDDGEDLVRSRQFWLPEGHDVVPTTLAAMWLMAAAPKLAAALASLLDALSGLPISVLSGPAYDAIYHARKALSQSATGDASTEHMKTIVVNLK